MTKFGDRSPTTSNFNQSDCIWDRLRNAALELTLPKVTAFSGSSDHKKLD